jgi:16S rRNA processing protein RimM
VADRAPDRLLVGQIGKPHGLSGEVYVVPISDDPRRFEAGSRLLRENGSALTVASTRPHGDRLLVTFDEVGDRDAAEEVRGALFVSTESARPLEEDEFWPHELVGCNVQDTKGNELGRVRELIPGTAQDLLRIESSSGERLIPFVADIVKSVDPAGRRIVIDPPDGLLD